MVIEKTSDNDAMVTITLAEYAELQHDSEILAALYAGGVDNWEWYGEAMDSLEDGIA